MKKPPISSKTIQGGANFMTPPPVAPTRSSPAAQATYRESVPAPQNVSRNDLGAPKNRVGPTRKEFR